MNYKQNWYDYPLVMPVGDIYIEYRQAKDKKKQIDILADENDTKPCRIAWLLDRCGAVVDKYKMPRVERLKDGVNYVEIWEKSEDAAECDRIRAFYLTEERAFDEVTEVTEKVTEVTEKVTEVTDGVTTAEKTTVCESGADKVQIADEITAELWAVFLKYSGGIRGSRDVAMLRKLDEVAKEMEGAICG